MEASGEKSCRSCSPCWRLPLLLGLVLAGVLISRNWVGHSPQKAGVPADTITAAEQARQHVSLTIDFGDGRTKDIVDVPWQAGMTAADLLAASPGIAVEQKGTGDGALLTSINRTANEGRGGKNWTFSVNDQLADRSFAIYELQAGDHVLWTFGRER
jgi:hypothetical protein